jgi:hypothetical protein
MIHLEYWCQNHGPKGKRIRTKKQDETTKSLILNSCCDISCILLVMGTKISASI